MTTYDPSLGGFAVVGRMTAIGPALDVFSGSAAGMFQTSYDPLTGWNLVPGPIQTLNMHPLNAADASQSFTHPPCVVSWAPDRMDLFAVSTAGDLWHWWMDPGNVPQGRWGAESLSHPRHGKLVSGPTAEAQGVDKITVFARVGEDGALFACVWDPANGKRWSWFSAVSQLGWAPEPGPHSFAPAACSWDPSRIDLFAVSGKPGDTFNGGTVQHTWQQDFPGTPDWHPAYWEDAAAGWVAVSSPVAVAWLDQQQTQQITMLYCGGTNIEIPSSVGMTRWLGDHWDSGLLYPNPNLPFPGSGDWPAGNPAIASWAPGRLDAFWWRNDGTLQHGWNENGGDLASWGWEQFALKYPGFPPS
jgi:hypothetical protein